MPTVVYSNVDELTLSLYVPLPRPLQLPAGGFFERFEVPGPADVATADAIPGGRWTRPGDAEPVDVNAGGYVPRFIRSRMRMLEVDASLPAFSGLGAAFTAMSTDWASDMRRDPIEPAGVAEFSAVVTVARVRVPLRLVGDPPSLESPVICDPTRYAELAPMLASTSEHLTTPGFMKLAGLDDAQATHLTVARVVAAVMIALADLRHLQLGLSTLTHQPVDLVRQGQLPAIVPAKLTVGAQRQHAQTLLLAVNPHSPIVAVPKSSATAEQIDRAVDNLSRSPQRPFFELRREALSAFVLRGDNRSSVIHAALGAEVMLDHLLLHIYWEERRRPEEVAAVWQPELLPRIKTQLAVRLGGNWDNSRRGPVRDWWEDIVQVRNRTVHVGVEPAYVEAQAALGALQGLTKFVCDRLAADRTRTRYPRTALQFVGNEGLERRGKMTKALLRLQDDPSEVPWHETFANWLEVFRRCRASARGQQRRPDLARSVCAALWKDPLDVRWIAVDSDVGLACTLHKPVLDADTDAAFQAELSVDSALEAAGHVCPVWVEPKSRRLAGPWVEAYRLVPTDTVMIDGSDSWSEAFDADMGV